MKKLVLLTAVFFLMPSKCTLAQTDYKMAGPYEVVARDGEFRGSKGGSERDMKAAWDFAREGRHDEACKIINAYAETLQRLDGHDAPLCLIQGSPSWEPHHWANWQQGCNLPLLPWICLSASSRDPLARPR